jgi:hypothetical protein
MLVSKEIHFAASKAYSFHFEKQTLLGGGFEPKLDFPT